MSINKIFINRANREKEFKRLKQEGFNVRRSSTRNQLLHPMYVEDYPRKISEEEKGLGNTIYKTHFSVLYIIEEDRRKKNE